jgi:hypothetical protein
VRIWAFGVTCADVAAACCRRQFESTRWQGAELAWAWDTLVYTPADAANAFQSPSPARTTSSCFACSGGEASSQLYACVCKDMILNLGLHNCAL